MYRYKLLPSLVLATTIGLTSLCSSAEAQCSPTLVGQWSTGTSTSGVAVDGELVYIVGNSQLQILDVTDKSSPALVGQATVNGADDIALSGNLAFISTRLARRLTMVDISNLNAPVVLGSVSAPGSVFGVAASGTTGYVAGDGWLSIVDASNPSAPVLTSTLAVAGAFDVAVEGSFAYIAARFDGFKIVDVSNPAAPVEVASVPCGTSATYGVSLEGSIAYVADFVGLLCAFDVSNPANPVLLGSLAPAGSAVNCKIAVSDNTAYVTGGNFPGLFWAVDVTDPANMSVLASVNPGGDLTRNIAVSGSHAYRVGLEIPVLTIFDLGSCQGAAPMADAGVDFSVNEGQAGVTLDGSGSSDADGDALTYAWTQVGGTPVTLSDATAQQPTFDAPFVNVGGETLSFSLTVTANGESDTATVDVGVVNVNHTPVADATDDQSIAEGSLVTLNGADSFDVDLDVIDFLWTQTSGPAVTLSSQTAASPTFTAPAVASGTTATLGFSLTVDDGYSPDAPAPGFDFADVTDDVVITVTNVNNPPVAAAGSDQTVNENTFVSLSGGGTDPDGDALTFAWAQTGGLPVTLDDPFSATPSFDVPFVSAGGEDLHFELTVDDGYGGAATDSLIVHVQNADDPPLVSAAEPSVGMLWPPNHSLVSVSILGVSDPDDNATITITGVTQDEPTNGLGDGDTPIDAIIDSDGTVLIRAERAGGGNGRVYHIHFTASDLEGSASGVVTVSVPKRKKSSAVDDGELYDSTL